ncbi:MAG: hypothetical protein WA324_16065 [Bryobacteraceae bacterium]
MIVEKIKSPGLASLILGSLLVVGVVHSPLLAFSQKGATARGVAIQFNQAGLSSLTYRGKQFLSDGTFQVGDVEFQSGTGTTVPASLVGQTSVNVGLHQVTNSYPWGNISAQYIAIGSRLEITITTQNSSQSTIATVVYSPFTLVTPQKPTNFDGIDPLVDANIGAPTVEELDYGSGVAAWVNEDPSKPLMSGFPWSYNAPTDTQFPVRINTGQDSMYPTFYPNVVRPIPPGASDTYQLSLRFGPEGSTPQSLAPDVFETFADTFPSVLNWTDRRAIGQLILATSATGWATNPRGWLLDPSIDVTTSAGIAAFHARVLQWAEYSAAQLVSMNAQGMVTWDIEGEQYPQPDGTYVGDPSQIALFAPEMDSIADAYFAVFRNAGLKVGVCIRPQNIVRAANGSSATQNYIADPTQLLINKILYAKQRWGATIFYVDSNVDPNGGVDDANIFQRVVAAVPGVLILPEHSNLQYYAYTAPYLELDQNYTSSPTLARITYPNAFSVLSLANGDTQTNYGALLKAVEGGDALMFRGWFAAPENLVVTQLYQAAAQ